MGYYSDVRVVVSSEGFNELLSFTENSINISDEKNLLKHMDVYKTIEDDVYVYFGWNSIKWGYGTEAADKFRMGLDHIVNKGYGCIFSYIGEDLTDIQEVCHLGEGEIEECIPWPSIERFFDDDYWSSHG